MEKIIHERKITRNFKGFDIDGNLLAEKDNIQDFCKALNIRSTTPVYRFANTETFFKPYRGADHTIRVEYTKTETKTVQRVFVPTTNNMNGVIKNLKGEIWSTIDNFSLYRCSNFGRVKKITDDEKEFLVVPVYSTNKTKKRYADVYLTCDDGEKWRIRLHRLVAQCFIDNTLELKPGWSNKKVVNHIDNNSENNIAANLEVVSQKENLDKARELGIQVGLAPRKCYAKNLTTGEIKYYDMTKDLVMDLTGKTNLGYFSHAVKYNHPIKNHKVGYIDENGNII